jgi:hypothetical protein
MLLHSDRIIRLLVALLTLLTAASAIPSYAASISFTPAGRQRDRDLIDDISNPPDRLIFKIRLDLLDLAAGSSLSELRYEVTFDPKELELVNKGTDKAPNPDNVAGFFNERDVTKIGDTEHKDGKFAVRFTGGAITGGKDKFYLDELEFKPLRPQDPSYLKTGDGESDFDIRLKSAIFGGKESEMHFSRFQEVEVQAMPEPGTCALLGAGLVGLALLRRLRP